MSSQHKLPVGLVLSMLSQIACNSDDPAGNDPEDDGVIDCGDRPAHRASQYDSKRGCFLDYEVIGCRTGGGCDDYDSLAVGPEGKCWYFGNFCDPEGFETVSASKVPRSNPCYEPAKSKKYPTELMCSDLDADAGSR